jgi:hypothetical protein
LSSKSSNARPIWAYGILCFVSLILYLLIYSSVNGEFVNSKLVTYRGHTYSAAGIQSVDSAANGWVINDNASIFVNLPDSAKYLLAFMIPILSFLALYIGVRLRSVVMLIVPLGVALALALLVRTGYKPVDDSAPIVILIYAILAAGGYQILDDKPAWQPRGVAAPQADLGSTRRGARARGHQS